MARSSPKDSSGSESNDIFGRLDDDSDVGSVPGSAGVSIPSSLVIVHVLRYRDDHRTRLYGQRANHHSTDS